MSAEAAVLNYKRLAEVERAFRTLKGVDLQVRPIRHRLESRVKAHIFLSMLAYYVQWHLAEAWKPLFFADEAPADKAREREPVAPARRSAAALAKVQTRRLADGTPAFSFRGVLTHLATIVRNAMRPKNAKPGTGTFTLSRDLPVDQRMDISLAVQSFDRRVDCAIKRFDIGERLMGQMMRLEIAPDNLDVIELRCVFGQPLDGEPVLACIERRPGDFADMDRPIILDQHDGSCH